MMDREYASQHISIGCALGPLTNKGMTRTLPNQIEDKATVVLKRNVHNKQWMNTKINNPLHSTYSLSAKSQTTVLLRDGCLHVGNTMEVLRQEV